MFANLRIVVLALCLLAPLTAQFGYVMSSYHGVSSAVHQLNFNSLQGQGYRIISLAVAGGLANQTYSAVWQQASGPAWVTAHGMSASQYASQRLTWSFQGYRPKIVTASGNGSNTVFAAVFVQDGVSATHTTDMTLAAFEADAAAKRNSGYRLVCCATSGSTIAPRFAPIYEPSADVAWGWEANDTVAQWNVTTAAHSDGDNRPAFLASMDAQRYLTVWHDDRVDGWAMVADRTSAQFANDKVTLQGQGLYLARIAASGGGLNARYGGIFLARLTPRTRTLSHSGPASIPLSSFDQMMDAYVVSHGIRAASIAVVRNGKLVHTRGYTYAEPGYPQTTPTSLFRIGSISKALCGMVAHDVIDQGTGGLTLNSFLVNTLGITNYGTGIGNVQLQQLLTHSSGFINVVDEYDAADWANPGNPQMPPDESVIVGYASLFARVGNGSWKYSNAGNTAIGQMIEQATGQDYFTALNNRLMAPMGVTRFGRMQGPKNTLMAGEVRYHLDQLYVRSGNLFPDGRLLAPQYSQRFWDSAGGVVTSAVDLARVIAGSFQIGGDSPVFSPARQAAILNRQSFPEYGNSSATSQWTDGSWGWQEHAPGEYTYWHDGAQDGFRSLCMFRSDGVGVVTLFNGDHRVSLSQIQTAIDAVASWPSSDQFPNHGLASFPRSPHLTSASPTPIANLSKQPIVVTGENLDQVTSVLFDSTTLVPTLSTAWETGYIQQVNATTLHVYPPQGLQPGGHSVQAFNAQGSSNAIGVQVMFAPTFQVAAQNYVIGGSMPFTVFASRGQLSNLSWAALAFSESTLPSIAPGVLSLGIGNQFSNLFHTDLIPFDPANRLVHWDFPGVTSWSHVDLQVVAIDLLAPTQFPLLTTNVATVNRL